VNFARRRLRTNEETHFALVSRLQRGFISQFATLGGVKAQSARRIEIALRPRLGVSRHVESGNPFPDGARPGRARGATMRVGLGGQFTLDATIPDFGQVEADPAVINLTAFEQFFEERRPSSSRTPRSSDFTLSGGRNRLYYSRRLGRAPRGSAPGDAQFADAPSSANIVGAVKLTGRTERGLSLGALVAVTEEADGRAFLAEGEPTRPYLVEPRSENGVVRLRQDFNGGASTVGAIVSSLQRRLPGDGAFNFLPSSAYNGGVDWEHQWDNRAWAFFGYVAGSHVQGDSTALLRIQSASNHFFQRPDARRLRVDSSATSMTGWTGA
jgi:hypothetical protein